MGYTQVVTCSTTSSDLLPHHPARASVWQIPAAAAVTLFDCGTAMPPVTQMYPKLNNPQQILLM